MILTTAHKHQGGMIMPVSVEVQDHQVHIRVGKEFNFFVQQDFRRAYQNQHPASRFVVDLSHTELIDSSALGQLLILRDFAGGEQADVVIANSSDKVREILKVAHFDDFFQIA